MVPSPTESPTTVGESPSLTSIEVKAWREVGKSSAVSTEVKLTPEITQQPCRVFCGQLEVMDEMERTFVPEQRSQKCQDRLQSNDMLLCWLGFPC
mmetsp:Transcript_26063/g.35922  ORF Transcript_26063/g.35922 Transcript_26063/m.35922 type:complete len:95 (-) Transcript_26063:378-662(-)